MDIEITNLKVTINGVPYIKQDKAALRVKPEQSLAKIKADAIREATKATRSKTFDGALTVFCFVESLEGYADELEQDNA